MYKEVFHQRLKQARKMSGFTQVEVKSHLDIPQPTLARYETGRSEPDIETMAKLAEFYGVSIDWLCGIGSQGRNPNYYDEMRIRA